MSTNKKRKIDPTMDNSINNNNNSKSEKIDEIIDPKFDSFEKGVVLVYKPVGWTPLEVINEMKKRNNILKDEKIGYAGRLDPMVC